MSAQEIAGGKETLTTAQIEFFKVNGYLILDNLIEPPIVERWQQAICECFEVSSEDNDYLNASRKKGEDFKFTSESSLGNYFQLYGVVKQLVGSTVEFASEDL